MFSACQTQQLANDLGAKVRQVIQNMQNGTTELAEAPSPGVTAGSLLVQTRRTLISAGTERMLVEFGRSSMIAKAAGKGASGSGQGPH
jgi:hypothetical protein